MPKYAFPDRSAATRLIVSVDGEGKNLPLPDGYTHPDPMVTRNGWHTYTLLAASDDDGTSGRHKALTGRCKHREPGNGLARNYGLATLDCLEFMLNLPAGALAVSFYFSYDVTKLIADLPLANQRELASGRLLPISDCDACAELKSMCPGHYRGRVNGLARRYRLPVKTVENSGIQSQSMIHPESTIWNGYLIEYIPRKELRITNLAAGRTWNPADKRYKWNSQVIVWDVFGFFQQAYVSALRNSAGVCPPEIIDRIEVMKAERGNFAALTDAQILSYCYEECYYLSKLVRDMLENLERFGLKLNGYDGTGAIARAWMKRENIKEYKSDTNLPLEIQLCAYFGGRFEVSILGYMGSLYSHDINSAYPYIASDLPCLAHGQWKRLEPGPDGLVPFMPGSFAVYLAGSKTSGRYAPFAFRIDDKRVMANPALISPKSVYYAHGGQRWVWSNADPAKSEIAVARKHFGTDAIPLHDGWIWEPACDHKPFHAIPEMYEERRKLKADGPGTPGYDGIEKVIKLLLNSIYGKTAQSVGSVTLPDGTVNLPVLTSFIWAGLITSGCRAMILDAVMQGDVVSIATDGILSRTPLDGILPVSKQLGDWDMETVEDAYLFQSGVYTMLKPCKPGCKHPGTPEMTADGTITHAPYEHEYTTGGSPAVRVYKTRGFSRREIPASKLIDAWNAHDRDALTVEPESGYTRFVPFKQGVTRNDALDYIGQWVQSNHKVTIGHNRRVPDIIRDPVTGLPREDIGVSFGSQSFTFADTDMSAPYTLKESWADIEDEREYFEGDYYEWRADDMPAEPVMLPAEPDTPALPVMPDLASLPDLPAEPDDIPGGTIE